MKPPGTPRGTYDSFDEHLRKVETTSSTLAEIARSWGFGRVDVPTFEHAEVFRLTSEFSAEKCYTFNDKSGRELVLRPDINAPLSRVIATNFTSSPMPVRFFFADKVFRYRHGKKREFRMFCLETFGIADYSADIEAIQVVAEAANRLGFAQGHIEHSDLLVPYGVIETTIETSESSSTPAQIAYNLRLVKDSSAAASHLLNNGFPHETVELLLEMLYSSPDNGRSYELLSQAVRLCPTLEQEELRIRDFADKLTALGFEPKFEIGNLHGSGFYSGLTYRFVPGGFVQELADGGRYDHMVEKLGGPSITGTGIGFGIERIIRFAESLGVAVPDGSRKGLLYSIESVPASTVQPIICTLRQQGLIVEQDLLKRKHAKALRFAELKGYKAVVTFVAETESGDLTLRLTRLSDKTTVTMTQRPHEVVEAIVQVM